MHTLFSSCFLPASVIIQCESIRPAKVRVDQNFAIRTVQISALDFSNVTPVCPEQIPKKESQTISIRDPREIFVFPQHS